MEDYTSIFKRGRFEFEDRKSVFIGESSPVTKEDDAIEFIREIKKKYPDARHHVYAYSLRDNSVTRYSDDREPQGSAGLPVLDVIRKSGYVDVVVVVVRYFGGILLGTGGLVRAYTEAARGALEAGEKIRFSTYVFCDISVGYTEYQKILPLNKTHEFHLVSAEYTDVVTMKGKILKSQYKKYIDDLANITFGKYKILSEKEKFDFIK